MQDQVLRIQGCCVYNLLCACVPYVCYMIESAGQVSCIDCHTITRQYYIAHVIRSESGVIGDEFAQLRSHTKLEYAGL